MSAGTAAPSDRSEPVRSWWLLAAWMLCAAGGVARFVNLDADPIFSLWIGYLTDEGRWNETARNLALFGRPDLYGISKIHLILGSGYQAVNFLLFETAGVSLWTARLSSAVAGSLVIVLTVAALRRHVDALALLAGTAVLAFSVLDINLSRLAIPEMPALLCVAAAFFLLVSGRASVSRAFVAGVLVACGAAMKGTTVLVAPAFVLVSALAPEGEQRVAGRRIAGLLAGLVAPALVGLALAAAAGLLVPLSLPGMVTQLAGYLRPGSAYDLFARAMDDIHWGSVLCLLLGAWYGTFLVVGGAHRRHPVLGRWLLATGAWSAWALCVWAVQQYSPGRYLVHVLYPLTLHAVVVATIWRREPCIDVPGTKRVAAPRVRPLWIVWLILPTAILLAPLPARLVPLAGVDLGHLSGRVLLLASSGVLLWVAVWRVGPRPALVRLLLAFPAVMGAFWLVNTQLARPLGFWFSVSPAEQAALAIAIISSVVLAAVRRLEWLAPAVAAAVVATGLAASPMLYAPTYVVRDASRELQRRFEGELVCSVQASSFFLDNDLRYRDDLTVSDAAGGAVILAHPHGLPRANALRYLHAEFDEERGYEIPVSTGYLWEPGVGEFPQRFVRLEVFRRARPPSTQ